MDRKVSLPIAIQTFPKNLFQIPNSRISNVALEFVYFAVARDGNHYLRVDDKIGRLRLRLRR